MDLNLSFRITPLTNLPCTFRKTTLTNLFCTFRTTPWMPKIVMYGYQIKKKNYYAGYSGLHHKDPSKVNWNKMIEKHISLNCVTGMKGNGSWVRATIGSEVENLATAGTQVYTYLYIMGPIPFLISRIVL